MVPYRHCRLDRQSLDRQSGDGRDARSESGMMMLEKVGHDEEGSAWYYIVIAWCYRHCRLDRQSGGGEMPDRSRA